ncbi:MAG: hypothetical protein KatS3mg110_0018 [Pirellulaceae bacterium]|nr:MAG: hypothetical protein KatS3mg110_0018 [Pirellulaceae bacterium]
MACIQAIRCALPGAVVDVRMDSAFLSDEIAVALDQQEVQFSIAVLFERFIALKEKVESRKRWLRLAREQWYFEKLWKPDCWLYPFRFVFVRTPAQRQMLTAAPSRRIAPKRTALWVFGALHTFRQGILQRAGRLTRPRGIVTLTISAPYWMESRLLATLKTLQNAL